MANRDFLKPIKPATSLQVISLRAHHSESLATLLQVGL